MPDMSSRQQTSPPDETKVIIAGAGPTGLALACVLAAEHVPFVIVDRLLEASSTSRAAVIHARTLEALDELQVTARLHAQGLVVTRFAVRDRDRTLLTISFDDLPTRYPHALMVPQAVTEALLLTRLRELDADLVRGTAVLSLQEDPSGVRVSLQHEGQPARWMRARYLVGCDGMHSTVRTHAGIAFRGAAYAQEFVLADVRLQAAFAHDVGMLLLSPDGLVVIAPLPGGCHRVVASVDNPPDDPGVADVQRLLDARGPRAAAATVESLVWSSRFRVHHRLAERYRAGHVLLAGDAAHVHSPAGGQGMNTGIQDAIVLGHLLASVVHGRREEGALDEYERRRRPVAKRVVTFTDRMTRMATLRTPGRRALRNAVLTLAGRVPSASRMLAIELAGLRHRGGV